jgi:hypothetical protein
VSYWLVLTPGVTNTYVAWVVGGNSAVPTAQSDAPGGQLCGWCSYAPSALPFALDSGTVAPPPPQVTTSSIPGIGSGAAYSKALNATGATGSYQWCVLSVSGSQCDPSQASLPAGFTLNSVSGLLNSTGTPDAAVKSYPFSVQVTDSSGSISQPQALTLNIACPAIVDFNLSGQSIQYMLAEFVAPQPNNPNSTSALLAYAKACGFDSFNWQQLVTHDPGGSRVQPVDPQPLIASGNVLFNGVLDSLKSGILSFLALFRRLRVLHDCSSAIF